MPIEIMVGVERTGIGELSSLCDDDVLMVRDGPGRTHRFSMQRLRCWMRDGDPLTQQRSPAPPMTCTSTTATAKTALLLEAKEQAEKDRDLWKRNLQACEQKLHEANVQSGCWGRVLAAMPPFCAYSTEAALAWVRNAVRSWSDIQDECKRLNKESFGLKHDAIEAVEKLQASRAAYETLLKAQPEIAHLKHSIQAADKEIDRLRSAISAAYCAI